MYNLARNTRQDLVTAWRSLEMLPQFLKAFSSLGHVLQVLASSLGTSDDRISDKKCVCCHIKLECYFLCLAI